MDDGKQQQPPRGVTLMVAVDGSEPAERGFARAISLAQPGRDRMVLLYVIDAVSIRLVLL